MFGRAMATRSDAFAVLLVISVCNLSRASSEGKGMIRENEGKMAEAWDHCMKEMKEKIVAVKDFDLYIPQATDDLISTLLTEQGIHKAINTLPPQVREGVIDCLRKNGLIFHASDPEVTSSYIRWHPSGGVLDYSLHVSKKVSGKGGKKKKNKGTKTVVIAIAATSVTTFILVAVIFFCCLRKMTEPKEEKPLLHLTDYLSEGSSHKSISLGSLSNKEPATSDHDDPSASSLPMEDKVSLLPKPPGSEVTTGAGLKPPPGRPFPPPPAPPPAAPSPAPRAPPLPPAHAAPPPPPPKGVRPPPPPKSKAGPPGGRKSEVSTDAESESSQKAKLKPFFWDKVAANTDQLMVWHEIRGGSFQFSEEMIEILFGCQATANKSNEKKEKLAEPSIQYIQIIDPRKAQNLAILLRALNITTQEVVNALKEGFRLPGELLQTLQKMTPTPDEELKLRLFAGDINLLGPAERFLKTVVEIPFAFKRIDALLFMSTFPEEAATLRESLSTLEVACTKLKNSRLFMKLLEAVLKTGNRMNDGTYRGGAQAFKLDTLLKLSDVKGTDGKTTLLHFVVQEIIRYEGIRCIRSESSSQGETLGNFKAVDLVEGNEQENEEHYRSLGLEVVSGVTTELDVVRKAAAIDADVLPSTVIKLDFGLKKAREFLNTDMKGTEEEAGQFYLSMSSFADAAEADIKFLSEEEKKIMELIKSTADYFHGQAGTKEGLRLFAIVRDFLTMLDKVCKEIRDTRAKQLAQKAKESKKEVSKARASQHNRQKSSSEPQQDKDSKKEGSSEPASIENQQQSSSEHQQFIDFQKEGSSAPASQENQQQLSLEHQQEKDSEKEGLLAPASQENQQQMSPENQQQLSSERQQEKDSEKEGSLVPVFQENQQQPSLEHQQDKDSKKDGSSAQTSQENQQQTLPENQQQRSSEHQQNKDSAVTASQENQQQMSSENQQQLSLEHQQDKDTEKYGLLAPASQGNQQQPSLEHQQDEDSKKEGSSAPASQENQQQTSLENQQQLSSKRQQDKDSEKEGSLAPASQENQQQSSLEHQQDKDSEKDGSLAPASKENQQHRSLENQQDEDSKKEGSSASASQENQQQTSLENQQQPSSKRQQDKDSEKEGSFAPASQENQQQPSLEHQQDKDSEKEGSSAPTSQENQQQSSLELQQYKDSHKEDSSAPASQENQQQTSSETQQQPSSERQQGNDSEKEGSLAPALQENQQQSSLEHQKDNDSKRKDH